MNLEQITYQEYWKRIETLHKKIGNYTEHKIIDVIVPILRSGWIVGLDIASRTHIKNIIPVQYGYMWTQLHEISTENISQLKNYRHALIIDANVWTWTTMLEAKEKCLKVNSEITISTASLLIDKSTLKKKSFSKHFYVKETNELRKMPWKEIISYVFPWENFKEEKEKILKHANVQ